MIIGYRHPARQFELFSPEAADGLVGQTFDAKLEQEYIGKGRVIAAKVVDHGLALDLIIEFPDDPRIEKLIDKESLKFEGF